MSDAPGVRLAALIEDLVRSHAAATPPPRVLPYLGLEHASGTGFHLLDALSARGIFRKYEFVLDLGAGLGGTSRWLATRLGCKVVGISATQSDAVAGTSLTRRARLSSHVRLVPAAPHALPFRDGRFTHVWILETLARLPDTAAVLAEAHRTLRRGGTLAMQELVSTGDTPSIHGWRFASTEDHLAALAAVGFIDVESRDRSAEAAERSAQVLAARARLLDQLRADPALRGLATERTALAAALASGAIGVMQMLARRA